MDMQRIKAGNFARNNGRVLQAANILRIKFNKLAGIERVVKSSGMAPDEFLESKLTSRGKRLLKGGIEDNMIEI